MFDAYLELVDEDGYWIELLSLVHAVGHDVLVMSTVAGY
jgi:hypothetical protein